MKWTSEAEKALSKIPFFVKKGVRRYVEEEADINGTEPVDPDHIKECREKNP